MLLGSCKQEDDQAVALADLQAQMEEMQKGNEYSPLVEEPLEEEEKEEESELPKISESEFSDLKIENKVLRGSVDRSTETLKKSESKIEELEKTLEDLQKEFEEYRKKYLLKIRAKAEGMKLATLEIPSGKIYKDVVISEVTELRIKLRHAGGAASLNVDTAPSEWVKKYALVSKESLVPEPFTSRNADGSEKAEMDAADAIAIITGDKGVGTGFFVEGKGGYYLYTAAHVLSGNKQLEVTTSDGRKFKSFGRLEIAEGEDLVRLAIGVVPKHALELPLSGQVQDGVGITAFGNSGGGVVNQAEGTVNGIGDSSFEVTAEIIQGNSGGAIVERDTSVALGVVTHAIAARTDVWAQSTRFTKVRRFAARLDRPIEWKTTTVFDFLKEPKAIEEIDRVTRLIFTLSMLQPSGSGLRLNTLVGEGVTAMDIFRENSNMRAVQDLLKMNEELRERKIGLSKADLKKQYSSYYRDILSGSKAQSYRFQNLTMSSFHKKRSQESLMWRAKAEKALAARVVSMR